MAEKKLTLKGRGRRIVIDSTKKTGTKRRTLSLNTSNSISKAAQAAKALKEMQANKAAKKAAKAAKYAEGLKIAKAEAKIAKAAEKAKVAKIAEEKAKLAKEARPSSIAAKKLNERMLEHHQVWRDFKPLQIGIDVAVRSWCEAQGWSYSKRILGKAFNLHTRDLRYRRAMAKGGVRYTLDEAIDGEVDELMQDYARMKVDKAERRIEREKAEIEAKAEKSSPE
ncbi:MAG: hypothetical protein KAH03_00540 [Cocleimonas sp.]|nr:hypothetical protein [Cocleimonas sp.]